MPRTRSCVSCSLYPDSLLEFSGNLCILSFQVLHFVPSNFFLLPGRPALPAGRPGFLRYEVSNVPGLPGRPPGLPFRPCPPPWRAFSLYRMPHVLSTVFLNFFRAFFLPAGPRPLSEIVAPCGSLFILPGPPRFVNSFFYFFSFFCFYLPISHSSPQNKLRFSKVLQVTAFIEIAWIFAGYPKIDNQCRAGKTLPSCSQSFSAAVNLTRV